MATASVTHGAMGGAHPGSRILYSGPLEGASVSTPPLSGPSALVSPPPAERVVAVGPVTATQVTGLEPQSTYRARIRARDAAGNWSAYSDLVVVTTAAVGTGPSPLTVAAVAAVPVPGVRAIPLTTVSTGAAIPLPMVGTVRSVTTPGTSATVSGLTASTGYTARVRARDAAGNWSAYSASLPFTMAGAGVAALATVSAAATVPQPTVGFAPPTVVAGRSRPVANGQQVTLDVTATPPNGQIIGTYLWSVISGGGTLTNANTATPTYTAPLTGNALAVVRATVSTTNGGTATADVTVSYHSTVVAAENALPGTPRATWDLSSPNLGGVSTLQGFCDGFSVDKSATANFKIAQSDTAGWSAEIYRLGYYGDNGARSYGVLTPTGPQLSASQAQPAPVDADPETTLLSADCSAWTTTLSWTPPSWAPSGIYLLRLNRTGGGASHLMFVLRDDARRADLMVMPSDSTWNAYNAWGGMGSGQYSGNSLYFGTAVNQYAADCAHYVSYDRPVVNRGANDVGRSYGAVGWSNFFTSEYPMVRFLERNGHDAKYYGCIDAAGDAAGTHLIGNGGSRAGANAAMMIGHNEYWSNGMRAGWEAASAAGVSLFTCASNEVFWRLVGTVNDASGRPRIWECQKSTINGRGGTRPSWTGTWRDPDGAGKGGGFPENTLTGTIFAVNGPDLRSLVVPVAGGYASQPLWRHTSVANLAAGQSFSSPGQILGFEWDVYGPSGVTSNAGQFMAPPDPRTRYCSDVTYNVGGLLLDDAGDVYTNGSATHRLVVKPGGNGSLVFGTGSMNWSFGCDNANTYQIGADNTSGAIQQATINMLTDMGSPPATPMSGLTQPTAVDWFVDAAMTTIVTTAGVTNFSIATGTSATALPPPVSAAASMPTMAVRTSAGPTPATFAAGAVVPSVAVKTSVTGGLASAATVAELPAMAASAGSQVASITVLGVAVMSAAGVSTGSRAQPSTALTAATVPAPIIEAGTGTEAGVASVAATATVGSMLFRSAASVGLVTAQCLAGVIGPGFRSSAMAGTLAVQAVASVGAIDFRSGSRVQLEEVATAGEVFSPGIVSGSATTINLLDVEAVADIATPSFRSAATAVLAAIIGSASVPALSVRLSALRALAVVTATAGVPQPQTIAEAGSGIGLAAIPTRATVPNMNARTESWATGQLASVQASIPSFTVRVTLVARPNVVAATVTIWQPSLGADAAIQLTTLLAKAGAPQPRLLMIPVVFAHPHSVRITRPKGQVVMKRRSG